ncbi:outer membrane lipoprotein-sorting protein [Aquirufa beregesia]
MKYLFLFLALSACQILDAQSASEIIKKANDKMRGKSSQAEMLFKTTRPTWSREMSVKTWSKGTQLAMILVLSPAKEKGIVFLKRKKEVWNWMPALERSIKLPPSMMTNSWMGTDFTNDDLVKEASVVDDYQHRLLKDTTIGSRPCYKIELTPKASTAVVWGKLHVTIDKNDYLELYTEFYDEEGSLVNVMKADDIKMMDGRLIPTHLEMIPANKKNHKTEIFYKSIQFNREIDDNFFSIEKMKQFN